MNDLFCADCTTTKNVYPIITNDAVEPLCSKCIVKREEIDVVAESGRTRLDIDKKWPHLTVGRLKEQLDGVPNDTPVLYQRIEDFYFDEHGWKGYEMEFELPDNFSEYILAWSAHWHWKKHAFVVEAHY